MRCSWSAACRCSASGGLSPCRPTTRGFGSERCTARSPPADRTLQRVPGAARAPMLPSHDANPCHTIHPSSRAAGRPADEVTLRLRREPLAAAGQLSKRVLKAFLQVTAVRISARQVHHPLGSTDRSLTSTPRDLVLTIEALRVDLQQGTSTVFELLTGSTCRLRTARTSSLRSGQGHLGRRSRVDPWIFPRPRAARIAVTHWLRAASIWSRG